MNQKPTWWFTGSQQQTYPLESAVLSLYIMIRMVSKVIALYHGMMNLLIGEVRDQRRYLYALT